MRVRFTRAYRLRLGLICLLPVLSVVHVMRTYLAAARLLWDPLPIYAPDCTFNDLHETFARPTSKSNGEENCWSLQEEILRIPYQSILNRNHMPRLGAGYKGGVHKARILLNGSRTCWAAVKSDHCHTLMQNPFFDRTGVPCIADYTYLWNDASYLGGEYTGAMLHYAAMRHNLTLSGFLPTYAVIVGTPLYSRLARSGLNGSPHVDPSILGAVMPLQSFTPLADISTGHEIHRNSTTFSRTMLPAAEAMAFSHDMGFVWQDIIDRNIGIRSSDHLAMLYDNTYFSHLATCRTFCDFCADGAVSKFRRQRSLLSSNEVRTDVKAFQKVIAPIAHGQLEREIRLSRSAHDLVKVFKKYS